jgi:ATP-dependent DNA helicase RecG
MSLSRYRNLYVAIMFHFVELVAFLELTERLRRHGGDSPDVEVKSAQGGLPESIVPTLSAFANRPGGGLLVLGVDERHDFAVVGVSNPALMSAAIANKARQVFDPPVAVDISVVGDLGVIAVLVGETPQSHKPCRVKATGAAYMRFADGDFRLSDLEIEGFLANRGQPRFDGDTVPGTTRSSLDSRLVEDYCATARESSRTIARMPTDEVLLMKTGVLDATGSPTVAGILALSDYPQQWFPNFVIQAGAIDAESTEAAVRFSDSARFDGPLPVMIDDALEWARRQTSRRLEEQPDGAVRSIPDIPPVVLRELIANAVVHRDLAPWSWSRAIEMRFTPDRFVLTNPGGLYGISVDRLGIDQLTSARNLALVRMSQYIRLRDRNVIEAMASGIPRVRAALGEAGLPAPEFHDQGIRFTAIVRRRRQVVTSVSTPRIASTPAQLRVLGQLEAGQRTATSIAESLGISPQAVRRTLAALRASQLVERHGLMYRQGGRV